MNIVIDKKKTDRHLLTWNKDWIASKFESPWGIFQKFQWANLADEKDIFDIFGTEKVKSKKSKQWSQNEIDLITMEGFDSTSLKNILGQDIKAINNDNLNNILGILINKNFIRKWVFYCPRCIENGYHSIFHQLSFLKKCVYHKTKLIDKCPKCGLSMLYKINYKTQNSAGICSCGNFFEEDNNNFIMNKWNKPLDLSIKLPEFNALQELNEEQKNVLQRVYYNTSLAEAHLDNFLYYILSIIDEKNDLKNGMHHHKLVLKNSIKSDCDSLSLNGPYEKLGIDIYQTIKSSYNSLARRLRKLLFRSKSCINSLELVNFLVEDIREDEICPYAISYIKWRQKCEGYEERALKAFNPKISKRVKKDISPLSIEANNILKDILFEWENKSNSNRYNSVAIKWILNKIITHLLYYYYFTVLEYFKDINYKKSNSFELPFINSNIPFFAIVFPQNENDNLEFHWWIIKKKNNILNKPSYCPFDSIKEKLKNKVEYKFEYI